MRSFAKFALGTLLGISLALTGSAVAQAKDNCLLIVCVDAPILGPLVGTIGDSLEEVLSPASPVPPVPAPVPVPPVQPAPAPVQPAPPASTEPTTPSESGNEVRGFVDGEQTGEPLPSLSPSPAPSSTSEGSNTPRLLPDEDHDTDTFEHVGVLTPFIVGVLFMLLLVLCATSLVRWYQTRRKVGIHDTSALPHKHL